jgi:hypothetical protein
MKKNHQLTTINEQIPDKTMKNHQLSTSNHQLTINHQPPMKELPMKLTAFTHLGFLINRIIDAAPGTDLSFPEILDAACDRQLIKLVASRYGHVADFYFLLSMPIRLKQMEAVLRDAAAGFRCGGDKPASSVSGLCLVLDIVLEAIQQQCSPPTSRLNIQASEVALFRRLLNSWRPVLHYFASVLGQNSQRVTEDVTGSNQKSIITHCSKGFKGFLGVFRNYIFRRLITH